MICEHMTKLYQLCDQEGLKLSASDLIHIVCKECGKTEVCPSMMIEHQEATDANEEVKEQEPEQLSEASTKSE